MDVDAARRAAALLEYLVVCRDVLRLQAWDLYVSPTPSTEDVVLTIEPDIRRWWGKISIGSFFSSDEALRLTPDEQRICVAHELLHLTHAELWHWLQEGSWRLPLAPDNARAIEDQVRHQLECMVDFCARAVAPTLPLPPAWPESDGA